jgi:DNA-binding NarL/FixJ family response regulator
MGAYVRCNQSKCRLVRMRSELRETVRTLDADGFNVCGEANDGQQAVELAEKLSPDLIILDLSMPVMNGLQAAPALRRLVPESPIILYTLHADRAVHEKALADCTAEFPSP